jgi:hypothetical protein
MPLVIGLIVLLITSVVSMNEIVIGALRSASDVESADRAYFVAEAGIEDALYELSPHFAGYETPDLNTAGTRSLDFGTAGNPRWQGKWTIRSHPDTPGDTISGNFRENQKLILSYFNDTSGSNIVSWANAISTAPAVPDKISTGCDNCSITFKILNPNNLPAFTGGLHIDNDGDLGTSQGAGSEEGVLGLNEDSQYDTGNCPTSPLPMKDADCDGRDDEDSIYDPVIYWKITDENGRTLVPTRGCLTADANQTMAGTEICEKDFAYDGINLYMTLNFNSISGVNGEGESQTISDFISNVGAGDKIQFEFTIVAPLEQVDTVARRKIKIPYIEYEFDSPGQTNKPFPYFTIKSDGYYRDFKQSITSTVYPETAVPLFEFTIVQQQ